MYLRNRFYLFLTAVTAVVAAGYVYAPLFGVGKVLFAVLVGMLVGDYTLLYYRKAVSATRHCSDRFSNGDDNEVRLTVESRYPFAVTADVIDEIPHVFQRRDVNFRVRLQPSETVIRYFLRPHQRGVYGFGRIRVFVHTPLGLAERRYTCGKEQDVAVYPSYLMLNKYELLAMSNNLTELGIKKQRRVGHNTEFEQIKDYVQGDEHRTINWKASARRHQLMVNVYQDERSQQIISVIDKGRVMQQAFERMTLLDYAINAALVLSYVSVRREDKAGLVAFSEDVDTFVAPSKHSGQMQVLLESLYAQQTTFGETDFSALCLHVNKHLTKRSLLILYTNFGSMDAMQRQLPYLLQLRHRHRLLVVFFEDAELNAYIASRAVNTEEYYSHVIAEKFAYEKRLIVNTLKEHGIQSLLTTPKNLSIDVVNKYLELRQER